MTWACAAAAVTNRTLLVGNHSGALVHQCLLVGLALGAGAALRSAAEFSRELLSAPSRFPSKLSKQEATEMRASPRVRST